MTIPFTDLFTVLGKTFAAQAAANTARGTTIPTAVQNLLDDFSATVPTVDLEATATGIPSALSGGQSGLSSLLSGLQTFARQYLIETVRADNPQANQSLSTALAELIRQMRAGSQTVDASTPAISVAYGSANAGSGKIITSIKRSDGLVQENILAETITGTAQSSSGTASFTFVGPEAATSPLDHDWPLGSGVSTSLGSVTAASSLLLNGDMEDEDDVANAPDDWYVDVGTIGTTVKMTDVTVQTVAISGTPTAGHYRLLYSSADGATRATGILSYDAAASAVQTALRAVPGLEAVTVSSSGTSPNLTHTITFTGRGGQVAQLTSVNALTGGTPVITHNTTTTGSAYVHSGGKAVEFDSNGSQLIAIRQRVTLQPLTSYAVSLWAKHDVTPAAGTIVVELVSGDTAADTVIEDEQGFRNSFAFSAAAATTWKHTAQVVAAVNEQQTISNAGSWTGAYTLTFDGQTTSSLNHNDSNATILAALEALSNIAVGDVSLSGGALLGTPVVVTFAGRYAGRSVPLMTVSQIWVTGTGVLSVARTRPGSPAEAVFRTPAVLPPAVYLRIRIAIAISSGTSLFIDDVALSRMTALYQGGPLAAVFAPAQTLPKILSGGTPWGAGDTITLTVTNDRAGGFQTEFQRNFGMAALQLLLPSDAFGAETISDTLIA